MIIAKFQIKNNINRLKHFQKIFLVTNAKFEVIFKIFFLKFNNANILFGKKNTYVEILYY